LNGCEYTELINLAQVKYKRWAFMSEVMNIQVAWNKASSFKS